MHFVHEKIHKCISYLKIEEFIKQDKNVSTIIK